MANHVVKRSFNSLLYFSSIRLNTNSIIGTIKPLQYTTDNTLTEYREEKKEVNETNSRSSDPFYGISNESFPPDVIKKLLAPVNSHDVEIKPDGLIYLPEIMYRRILHEAFGPGGWGLMPRGDTQHYENESEGAHLLAREYALYCQGRFVAQSLGEHVYYSKNNLQFGKACESAKSNALMRCCKDLGVASELWDPKFVSQWKREYGIAVWCENQRTKEKKKLWRKKDSKDPFPYPWKEMTK